MTLAPPPPPPPPLVADKLDPAVVEETVPAGEGVGVRAHEDAAAVRPAE